MKLKIQAFVSTIALMLVTMTFLNCSDPKSGSRAESRASKQQEADEINQSDPAGGPLDPSKPKKSHPVSPVASSSSQLPAQAPMTESPAPATDPDGAGNPPPQNSLLALHQPAPTACGQCHESKRPSLTHYKDHDCASCHKFPSFKGASFRHDPKPASCTGCHTPPASGLRAYPNQGPPANFNAADPKALGSHHYAGKDCKECHQTPKEGAAKFVFTHSAPNPQVCLPCHFNNGSEEHQNNANFMLTGFGNCTDCHRNFDVKVRRDFGRN